MAKYLVSIRVNNINIGVNFRYHKQSSKNKPR